MFKKKMNFFFHNLGAIISIALNKNWLRIIILKYSNGREKIGKKIEYIEKKNYILY